MTCEHSVTEMDVAATADGLCPLCLKAEIERLRAALKECSDDLAAIIEHQYARTLDWPSQRRQYDRDMEPVVRARTLLGMVPTAPPDDQSQTTER